MNYQILAKNKIWLVVRVRSVPIVEVQKKLSFRSTPNDYYDK